MVALLAWWAAGLATLAHPALLEVSGDGRCPTLADVRAAVATVAPAIEWPGSYRAELIREGAGLQVRLVRDGIVLGERRLPPAPCHELARSAAVVIAAWQARLEATPTIAESLPPPPTTTASAPRGSVRPAPRDRDVGVAALGSFAGASWAPGVQAVLGAGLGRHGYLRVGGLYVTPHRLAIGPGQAAWWRAGGFAGVAARTLPSRRGPQAELGAEALLTALRIDGHGFSEDAGASLLDPGLAVSGRLVWRQAALGLQLGVTVVRWLGGQRLYLDGSQARGEVPRLEALLNAGAFVARP